MPFTLVRHAAPHVRTLCGTYDCVAHARAQARCRGLGFYEIRSGGLVLQEIEVVAVRTETHPGALITHHAERIAEFRPPVPAAFARLWPEPAA